MFGGIRRFICRHRRKFIIGGVVVGGFVFATHYAQRKLREWQEREMKDFLERTQRQQHFEKNEVTCNQMLFSLTPSLCDTIGKLLDAEGVLEKLRSDSTDKIALWEELKIISFARLSVLLYSGTLFVILLRVQVNLISGYLYSQMTSDSNSMCEVDKKLQEDYLKLCEYFLTTGVKELCTLIENKVRFVLEGESLKKQLTLQDIEHYFWAIQSAVCTDPLDPLSHLSSYLLPASYIQEVQGNEGTILYNVINETVDIIGTSEIKSLATSCINRGFAEIMDKISDYYIPENSNNQIALPSTSSSNVRTWSTRPNGLCSMEKVTKPLAKVIPIVNGLTNVAKASGSPKEVYEEWIKQFINLQNLKMLGANIYESYSNVSNS